MLLFLLLHEKYTYKGFSSVCSSSTNPRCRITLCNRPTSERYKKPNCMHSMGKRINIAAAKQRKRDSPNIPMPLTCDSLLPLMLSMCVSVWKSFWHFFPNGVHPSLVLSRSRLHRADHDTAPVKKEHPPAVIKKSQSFSSLALQLC